MKKIYLSLLAAAVAVGCGKGFEGDLSGSDLGSGDIIGVDVSMASDNATRGTIISEAKNIPSVGLYGFFAADDSYDIPNDNMTKSGSTFTPSKPFYWPSNIEANSQMQFFAYSPYVDSANGLTIDEDNTTSSSMQINYSVPTTVVNQPDLLIASTSASSGSVPLTFYHTLATIKFKVIGGGTQYIKSIKLDGLQTSGTLTVKQLADGATPSLADLVEWGSPETETKNSVTVSVGDGLSAVTPSDEVADITTTDGYLMMIPQTVAANSSIDLTLSDGTTETTKTINFADDQTWEAAKTYTYVVNVEEPAIEIDYTNNSPSNCYILNPSDKKQVFYIPIEGRINDFWDNYSGDTNKDKYRISDGDEWEVDILWSDIESTDDLTSDGFKVERVTEGFANRPSPMAQQ